MYKQSLLLEGWISFASLPGVLASPLALPSRHLSTLLPGPCFSLCLTRCFDQREVVRVLLEVDQAVVEEFERADALVFVPRDVPAVVGVVVVLGVVQVLAWALNLMLQHTLYDPPLLS